MASTIYMHFPEISPKHYFRLSQQSTNKVPSGYVKIAIENGPFIVDVPIKHVDFPYVELPEGKSHQIPSNPMKNHHVPMVFLWLNHNIKMFPWFSYG